ncbi:MAG: hypothetical protein IPL36_09990 [Nigerium sp.]|nr:hypothetical protein [Nigerium sp.]
MTSSAGSVTGTTDEPSAGFVQRGSRCGGITTTLAPGRAETDAGSSVATVSAVACVTGNALDPGTATDAGRVAGPPLAGRNEFAATATTATTATAAPVPPTV